MREYKRQHNYEAILEFVIGVKRANDGLSPTRRIIRDECNLSSTSVVKYILDELEREGKIIQSPGKAGGIKVVGGQWLPPPSEDELPYLVQAAVRSAPLDEIKAALGPYSGSDKAFANEWFMNMVGSAVGECSCGASLYADDEGKEWCYGCGYSNDEEIKEIFERLR
jgi:hypothetical protein